MKKSLASLAVFVLLLSLTVANAQDISGDPAVAFFATHHYDSLIDNPGLYTMNPDGTNRQLVISKDELLEGLDDDSIWDIALSPDGNKLAYTTYSSEDGLIIYDLQTDQITRLEHGLSPNWSADSQYLVIASITDLGAEFLTYEVIVFDIVRNERTVIWTTDDTSLEPGLNTVYLWSFAWSPDSSTLAISIERTPRVQNASIDSETDHDTGLMLFTLTLDGSDLREIDLPNDFVGYNPMWVEDDIYFACDQQSNLPPTSICQFSLETDELNIVGDFTDILPLGEWIVDFNILPDGRLVFSRSYWNIEGPGGGIYYADLSSGTITNIDESSDAMNILVQWIKPENRDQ